MKKLLVAAAAVALLVTAPAWAQSSGTTNVLSQRTNFPSVQTLAAVGPSTVTSADKGGFGSSMNCVYTQASHTGSPSVLFSIEGKYGGAYVPIIVSAAITTDVSTMISAGAGVATTANVGSGVSMPATWRTKIVESGGGSTVTGHVDCSTAN